jgi:pimeloyl-ACP methyl ester carboxylesterase
MGCDNVRIFTGRTDFIVSENGISSVEKVEIGGIDQYILIQAEDPTKPVLLFLHGGPSMPLPGVSNRGKDYTIATNTKELVKNFVLVFWDQRGTGKSYSKRIKQETMNVKQFIADANELTDYLRKRFSQEKIFLAGHSWGTIIGLSLISLHPEKFYSYVGISQIVSWTKNDEQCLLWAKDEAEKRKNKKAIAELNAVGLPPFLDSSEQWGVLRKWQLRFNSMVYSDHEIKHPGMFNSSKVVFQSKDYTLKDAYNSFYKGFKLVYTLDFIKEISKINFKEQTPKLEIPVTFIHGTKDVHLFGKPVEEYYQHLEAAKGKRLIWLDKSSHAFHPDDTKLIEAYIIEELVHSHK